MGYGWSSTTLRMTMVEVIFSTPGSRASCRLAAAHCDLLELRRRAAPQLNLDHHLDVGTIGVRRVTSAPGLAAP